MLMRIVRLLLAPAVFVCLLCVAAAAVAQEAVTPAASADLKTLFMVEVVPLLFAAIGAALTFFIAWSRSKTAKAISESNMSSAAKGAAEYASGLAFELVMAGVGEVRDWKAELADGKITQDEIDAKLAKLKAAALAKLREATLGRLLGSGAAPSLEAATGLTDSLVEAAVEKSKAVVASSAAAAAAAAPANPPAPPAG